VVEKAWVGWRVKELSELESSQLWPENNQQCGKEPDAGNESNKFICGQMDKLTQYLWLCSPIA
jgi:hypothetical protein